MNHRNERNRVAAHSAARTGSFTVALVIFLLAATAGLSAQMANGNTATATFAGGCFWCMEKPYDDLDGVQSTIVGYAGGHVENPTYEEVTAGGTGHLEVVQVTYDPDEVSYETLLYVFWRNIDPFDGDGQFCDQGASYRPAIFYETDEQRELARESRAVIEQELGRDVAVEIDALDEFYRGEEYHQNYYKKNPLRYRFYRTSCGRDGRLNQVWGNEARAENPDPMWLSGM